MKLGIFGLVNNMFNSNQNRYGVHLACVKVKTKEKFGIVCIEANYLVKQFLLSLKLVNFFSLFSQ